MSRGKRYDEPKLNMKKVLAVIIAIVVVIMFVFIVKGILDRNKEQGKIISKDYFVVYQNDKWGVIDEDGNIVIDPSYGEMITIPNSKNDVFLCIYDVNYETGEYKTKALNSKNQEIFTQYEQIEAIQNIDETNQLWYENNVLKVKQNGKYGLINLTGKELLPCEYEEIMAVEGIQNTFKVKKEGKYGVVNQEGTKLVETQYKDIQRLGKDNKAGFVVQAEDGKYGIVDYSQTQIIEAKYDKIETIYGNDYYVVEKDGKQILVKKDGIEVLTTGFDKIAQILKSSDNGIIYEKDKKYGIMKLDGTITINAEYDDLEEAKSGIFIAKQNDKYGIIDINKEQKLPFEYQKISYNEKADIYITENANFENNIIDNTFNTKLTGMLIDINDEKEYIEMREEEDYKYYNYKFEEKKVTDIFTSNTLFIDKKDGKYGFVDKEGNVVVDYKYDDAIRQNSYGYAAVKKDGKWGSIDNKGNEIQEPTYNLDEYLKIDFIGRWHLGQDINMNYYR